MSMRDAFPPGFTLRQTLRGHTETVSRIAWSPNGRILVSPSRDQTIHLWDAQTGQLLRTLTGHSGGVLCTAWSPDGRALASCSFDQTIRLWDAQTGQLLRTLTGHSHYVYCVAWSPDGRVLASCSADQTIRLWDVQTGQPLRTLTGHSNLVTMVIWSPDGRALASCSEDKTIRLWDAQTGQLLRTLTGHFSIVYSITSSPNGRVLASCSADQTIRLWTPSTGQQVGILEGHTNAIISASFSCDGHLLASKSGDGTVRIWRTDIWEVVAVLEEPTAKLWDPSLAFHPKAPILATLGEEDRVIRIWSLDVDTLLGFTSNTLSVHYTNAKVVLVGDSGVGKSGLSLVLSGQPFIATESTHGRHVWVFENKEVKRNGKLREIHETLLWDLAGQPDYRLIHQLYLNEVTVAVLVFDASDETGLFAGVRYWDRALRLAQHSKGTTNLPLKRFLVAARTDRGGRNVNRARIDALVHELGFVGYFETSAKEGWNISELAKAIREAIVWEAIPGVTSTNLFQHIKTFLVIEKQSGRLLSTVDDLYRAFLASKNAPHETKELRIQFETCLGHVEASGLIRRLTFGNVVLLQPELLDVYASALLIAVKNEPNGFGSIAEERVRKGEFPMSQDERLKNTEQEKLLLIAIIEEMLRQEIVLREQGNLIFPSQSTREYPNLPDPKGKAVKIAFEGSVLNIYTTLVIRLSNSSIFQKKELWKNAVTYTTRIGGTYGIFLHTNGEERGELTLFFDKASSEEMRFHFEEYVQAHLQRHALPESIQQRRIFICPECATPLDDSQVVSRRQHGLEWMRCSECDAKVSILDTEGPITAVYTSRVSEMDQAANTQRERSAAASSLQGKIAINDFDVFLCYNNSDKLKVKEIGKKLKEQGLLPWLDEWELRPGLPWQRLLEEQIEQKHIKSAAVFVGKDGIGPWQQMELEAFLREFVNRGCPVIPVLLSNASREPQLPLFLRGMTWVDFRKQDPDPMEQLIWGITGRRSLLQVLR